jgi:hypothetical protein
LQRRRGSAGQARDSPRTGRGTQREYRLAMRLLFAALGLAVACTESSTPLPGGEDPASPDATVTEPAADAAAEPAGPMGLGASPIRGVKWKNEMHGQDMASSFRFETSGLGYPDAIAQLCENGVRAVVLKQAEPNIMRWTDPASGETGPCNGRDDAWCKQRINAEIAEMIAAVDADTSCAEKPLIYVWQRQWFNADGKVSAFADDMADLIHLLRERQVADRLAGIASIESHLDGSCQTKNTALAVARAINARTGGWLRSRSLFFPGAGMGAYFKNIDAGFGCMTGLDFLDQIAAEVGTFSFIYKEMAFPYQGCGATEWDESVGHASTLTARDRRAWLEDACLGVGDLYKLLDAGAAAHPEVANLTFWGDSGDGIHLIPTETLQALHAMFVTGRPDSWRHHFFDLPYVDASACPETNECAKSILTVSAGRAVPNRSPSGVPTPLTVFGDWEGWTRDDTGY